MANIHTLRDYNTAEVSPYSGRPVQNVPTGLNASASSEEDGRFNRVKCIDLVFPGFKWRSFILAISLAEVGVFIAALIIQSYALTPTIPSLSRLGASNGPAIASGQVWRLITPLFLHASFWHILFNVFFQLRMGFPLEDQYGIAAMAGLYFLTGFCGNLFSVALAPCKFAVGASTAGFGLIGIQMCEIALTWHLIQRKEHILFNVLFFVLMTVMISVGPDAVVDWRGHVGGFIGGFCLGLLFNESMASKPTWYKAGKTAAIAVLGGLIVSTLVVIFGIPMSRRGC